MNQQKIFLVLDTNILLHYQTIDQIDWRGLFEGSEIILVLTTVVLKELEKIKIGIGNCPHKLRDRATARVKSLAKILDNNKGVLRDGVTAIFWSHEPTVDFLKEHGLSIEVVDDRFIACILDSKPNIQGRIFVVTDDLPLRLKLKAHRLELFLLPEKYQLPSEPDPFKVENETLKKKIAALEARAPQYQLLFTSRQVTENIAIKSLVPFESFFTRQLEKERVKYCPIHKQVESNKVIRNPLGGVTITPEKEIETIITNIYEGVDEYLEKYQLYIRDLWEYLERIKLHQEISFSLENTGSMPGTNINILIKFPDYISIYDKTLLETAPEKPQAPRMKGMLGLQDAIRPFNMGIGISSVFRTHDLLNSIHGGTPEISGESGEVRYWIKKLQHQDRLDLEPVSIGFRSRDEVKSFQCDYEIISDETPVKNSGKLHYNYMGICQ